MIPPKMRAAVYTKVRSAKVLEFLELEQPLPKEKEVLIKVCAASVNPLDWRLKSRRPGVDVAGHVVTVGRGVTQLKPGDAVFGAGKGAFAEYACAAEANLVPKPESMSFEDAAAIPIAALTALQGLRDKGHIQPGQNILINGASGGVGTFAVQIAKSFGCQVTGVCSTRNVSLVRSLGADKVIDYTREDFLAASDRYDLLLDNVGNRPFSAMRRVLRPRGRCILAGMPKEIRAVLARLLKGFLGSFLPKPSLFFVAKMNQSDLLALCEWYQQKKVRPAIDRIFPLSDLAEAIAYVESGHARAKVIVTLPQPDQLVLGVSKPLKVHPSNP
jgi:NADPH:quinone reductase-like Zn-dependent oxidoreductase